MNDIELFPLFPSNLIKTTYKEKEDLDELKKLVHRYEFIRTAADLSNESFKSKSNFVLKDIPEIEKNILKYFYEINNLILKYSCNFKISTSWFTKFKENSFSQFHFHRNSFYSGVLYFDDYCTNEKDLSAPIEFETPIINLSDFYIIPNEWNIHNCQTWSTHPTNSTLLFFPSYLKHRVAVHKSKKLRYSMAFNIIPTGNYGQHDSYYDTSWFS